MAGMTNEELAVELTREIEQLRSQLPEGMEHCTIRCLSCPVGHSWLTATNWIQHDCPTCERDRLQKEIARLRSLLEQWATVSE